MTIYKKLDLWNLLIVITCLFSFNLHAAQLSILSAGAVEPGLVKVVDAFHIKTGHQVIIQYGTSPQLAKKLADEQIADVIITPISVMKEQIKAGRVVQENPLSVGKVGAGITVRNELSNPAIGSVEQLKESLLKADSIVYNNASTGVYLEKLFDKLGIGEQLKPKTKRYANGDMVLTHIIQGTEYEIGFGAIPEIKMYESKGLRLVGPLPSEVQNYTSYVAATMKGSKHAQIANELLQFLTDKSNQHLFKEAGVD